MHRTQRNSAVFATVLTELYSSVSIIYPQHTFARADNQQKYLEISLEKYHQGSRHSRLTFVYKDLYQIKSEDINLHLVDN